LAERLELRELALHLGLDVERFPPHADSPGIGGLDEFANLRDELGVANE